VLEWGGDEETAIAALLHDAVEDQGGLETAARIRERFGDRVAGIVLACTDSVEVDPADKAPWEARKQKYVAKLASVNADVALVTASDKLHNLTAMIRDVRREGPATLKRFGAAPDRLLWYYTSVATALQAHAGTTPIDELLDGVHILRDLIDQA
jgi:(p)ppGpp synthase/HD superfamily hydrolase